MSEIQTRTMEEQGKPAASHILVVDDNPEIREVIYLLLGGEGYEVTEAANGEQAIEASAKYAFDLIILDIMMPGMNGYQTCVEIRKNSNAPILFLSAKSQEDDKMLGFSSGGDDYLVKPFSYNELCQSGKGTDPPLSCISGEEYAGQGSGIKGGHGRAHHFLSGYRPQ